jgi:hypothetical protein
MASGCPSFSDQSIYFLVERHSVAEHDLSVHLGLPFAVKPVTPPADWQQFLTRSEKYG